MLDVGERGSSVFLRWMDQQDGEGRWKLFHVKNVRVGWLDSGEGVRLPGRGLRKMVSWADRGMVPCYGIYPPKGPKTLILVMNQSNTNE